MESRIIFKSFPPSFVLFCCCFFPLSFRYFFILSQDLEKTLGQKNEYVSKLEMDISEKQKHIQNVKQQ